MWFEPELSAEIEYGAKSAKGEVRHPDFKGSLVSPAYYRSATAPKFLSDNRTITGTIFRAQPLRVAAIARAHPTLPVPTIPIFNGRRLPLYTPAIRKKRGRVQELPR
jgi:hypothetical protein